MIQSLLSRFSRLSPLYLITILALITCVCYFNTLGNGLFYDDEFFIYNNTYVQQFSVSKFFTENVDSGGGVVSNYYRPLLLTLFSLTYQVFGTLGTPYHFLSMFFHFTAGVGVFLLFRKFSSNMTAFLTATFFLIHPLQTESIAYASGISDPLYVTFALFTLLVFLTHSRKSVLLTPFLFLLTLLSKEAGFVTLALMILVAWMKEKSFQFSDYKKYFPAFISSIIVLLGYGALRLTALNFDNTLNFLNDNSLYATHLSVRLLTFLSILPTYLGLLLYPKTLFIDRVAQIVTTITPSIMFTCLTIFLLFLIPFLFIIRSKAPTISHLPYAICFSIAWFFISILPASGITPINGIIYEHFLYLPSIGFFFLITSFFVLLYKKASLPAIKYALLLLLTTCYVLLSLRTIIRNADWHSPFTLYPQLLQHNPRSIRALNNYAMALADSGEQQKAITYYDQSLRIQDTYPQVRYNMGNSYRALGEYEKAERAYTETIKKFPNFYQAYQSLYGIYVVTNQTEKAQTLLEEVKEKGKTNKKFQTLYQYLTQAQ